MKKYFYCQSYQAFNMALAMSLQYKIVIITSVPNIIKACKFLNILYLEHIHFSLNEMIINKRKVDKAISRIINTIGEDEVHYSHTQFAVFCFYLIVKLNKSKKKTFFHDFEFIYSSPNWKMCINRHYLKVKVYQIIIRYYLKIPVEVRMSSFNSFMICLKLEYIKKFNIINDKENYNEKINLMYKNIPIKFPEFDNLFIAQTFNNINFFHTERIEKILPILNNETIYVKNHPKLGDVKGLDNCKRLPSFLPVEIFFQKVKRNIISFHSASLLTATFFDEVKVISLIELVKTDDPFWRSVISDLDSQSKGRILFPQNLDELKIIINNK